MTEKDVLDIFHKNNALLKGHFKLSSGLHSENYLQCALVLQYPEMAEKLAKELAEKFAGKKIDTVIGPALGGITIAYEVARALGIRGIFAERQDGDMVIRRGFSVSQGENVLVVEDVITTGGSTREVIDAVKKSGGKVVGVGCIIDRSDTKIDFGAELKSLARLKIKTYGQNECPLCKSNIPITKPGSRK